MALFSNLPVYKLGYDLLIDAHKRVKNFSREHKFTLGEKIKEECVLMLIGIYKANRSKQENRIQYIESSREHLEILRLLFRIIKDLNVIGTKGFIHVNLKIEEVSKQLTSWEKFTARAVAESSK